MFLKCSMNLCIAVLYKEYIQLQNNLYEYKMGTCKKSLRL